jgi:hypothetical protein
LVIEKKAVQKNLGIKEIKLKKIIEDKEDNSM